jgi:hypothetical protein
MIPMCGTLPGHPTACEGVPSSLQVPHECLKKGMRQGAPNERSEALKIGAIVSHRPKLRMSKPFQSLDIRHIRCHITSNAARIKCLIKGIDAPLGKNGCFEAWSNHAVRPHPPLGRTWSATASGTEAANVLGEPKHFAERSVRGERPIGILIASQGKSARLSTASGRASGCRGADEISHTA